MARASRERVKASRARESEGALLERALATIAPPTLTLTEFDVIAELKLRSPAAGVLAEPQFDRDQQIGAYAAGGAAAISVLTEPDEFHGSLNDLEAATTLLANREIPAMRKDFLTEPYQVLEARAAGAGGVLVIVTMLDDAQVEALLACAVECGLFVLLEGFDERDLERISAMDFSERPGSAPLLCGVNCRDLKSLKVEFARFRTLATHLPAHLPTVAESGIGSPADIEEVARLGYRAALVGSALMGSPDPARELAQLLSAARQTVQEAPCS